MAGRILDSQGYDVGLSRTNVAMPAARRRSIQAYLFPAALEAVEPWDEFRWHGAAGETCDVYKEKSSQALAIDVFGSPKPHPRRDAVFDRLVCLLGVGPAARGRSP